MEMYGVIDMIENAANTFGDNAGKGEANPFRIIHGEGHQESQGSIFFTESGVQLSGVDLLLLAKDEESGAGEIIEKTLMQLGVLADKDELSQMLADGSPQATDTYQRHEKAKENIHTTAADYADGEYWPEPKSIEAKKAQIKNIEDATKGLEHLPVIRETAKIHEAYPSDRNRDANVVARLIVLGDLSENERQQ